MAAGTTVAMTYDEIATKLGISVSSARRLVLRRRWAKAMGNGGLAVIQVPVEYLSERADPTTDLPTAVPADPVSDLPAVAPADPVAETVSDLVSRLAAVHADMAAMAQRLGAAEGELRAVRGERDHLRADRDRWAEQAQRLLAPAASTRGGLWGWLRRA